MRRAAKVFAVVVVALAMAGALGAHAAGGAAGGARYSSNPVVIPTVNVLPNTQWKIATAIGSNTQMNVQGTGTESPVSVLSYNTGSPSVSFVTSSNGNLAVGDLVALQSPCDAALRVSTLRVLTIPDGTHFTATVQHNSSPSASAACNAVITNVGGASSSGTGDAFDGWSKSTTLQVWREYHAANVLNGSVYSAGVKKGSASSETMSHTPDSRDVPIFAGRTVVFGVWVRQKVKGGSGTWRAYIASNGTGGTTRYSASATTTAYQWAEVAYTVPTDATTLSFGVSFDGNSSDVYYVSQPMAGFGNYLGTGNYVPRLAEILLPKVKYSPPSYIGASITFPTVLNGGDYNFQLDFYAESNGAVAPTTRKIMLQLEGKTTCASQTDISLRDVVSAPIKYAIVNTCQSANNLSQAGWVTLSSTGYATMYSSVSGAAWSLVSIDMNGYEL